MKGHTYAQTRHPLAGILKKECWLFTGILLTLVLLTSWYAPPDDDGEDIRFDMLSVPSGELSVAQEAVRDCGRRGLAWRRSAGDMPSTRWSSSLGAVYQHVWDMAYRKGLFKVRLDRYDEKYIQNHRVRFLLSENPGRKEKRKGMPLAPSRLDEPFNPDKFHFGKISDAEVLMFYDSSVEENRDGYTCVSNDYNYVKTRYHPLVINPFPLGPRSGLLVPWAKENRSQLMTLDALELGLDFALDISASGVKVGYNSLGAGASVNHLHFQTWQPAHSLPVESEDLQDINFMQSIGSEASNLNVAFSRETAPVSYIRWMLPTKNVHIKAAARSIQNCINELLNRSIPHNLVLNGYMAFLFPRRSVVLLDGLINPGFPEVAGNVICPGETLFKEISADRIESHFVEHIRIEDSTFKQVTDACLPRSSFKI